MIVSDRIQCKSTSSSSASSMEDCLLWIESSTCLELNNWSKASRCAFQISDFDWSGYNDSSISTCVIAIKLFCMLRELWEARWKLMIELPSIIWRMRSRRRRKMSSRVMQEEWKMACLRFWGSSPLERADTSFVEDLRVTELSPVK